MMNCESGSPFFPNDAYLELTSGSEELAAITMDHDAIICFMTDGLARGLALSSKPPLRAFTATRRHPLAPTGSRGPTPAPG